MNGSWKRLVEARQNYTEALRELSKVAGLRYRAVGWGSTRPKPDQPCYRGAEWLAEQLALHGIDVVTGGGPGIMEALNKGAQQANTTAKSIGVTLEIPGEKPNGHISPDFLFKTQSFGTRLDLFGLLGVVFFALKGGFGTLLEVAYALQLIQLLANKGKSKNGDDFGLYFPSESVQLGFIPKLFVVGKNQFGYLKGICTEFLKQGTISEGDQNCYVCVRDNQELLEKILADRERWREFLQGQNVEPQN